MKKRNIALMVLFSIITFGIYTLVWYCSFQNQLKKLTGKGFGGAGHFFVTLFTCGIYQMYWQFAAGKRLAMLGAEDRSILYLIMGLFGFAWLNMLLMQNQANNLTQGDK